MRVRHSEQSRHVKIVPVKKYLSSLPLEFTSGYDRVLSQVLNLISPKAMIFDVYKGRANI